jgi:hypothetical protein
LVNKKLERPEPNYLDFATPPKVANWLSGWPGPGHWQYEDVSVARPFPKVPPETRKLLLSETTSHANKMHIVAEQLSRGAFVVTDWNGDVRKPVRFIFEPGGAWQTARDYLSDVMSTYKANE